MESNTTLSNLPNDVPSQSHEYLNLFLYIPCIFLWIFTPVEVYLCYKMKNCELPWSWINVVKLASSAIIIVDVSIYVACTDHDSSVMAMYIFVIISMLLQGLLIIWGKRNGLRRSAILFVFWFLMLLCVHLDLRRYLYYTENGNGTISEVSFWTFYILVIGTFLVHCFSERRNQINGEENVCPKSDASIFSLITFSWMDSLIWRGYKKPLEKENLWQLPSKHASDHIVTQWNNSVQKLKLEKDKKVPSNSIVPVASRTFWKEFTLGALLKLISDVLEFVAPVILGSMIRSIEGGTIRDDGIFLAVGLLITTQAQSLILGHYYMKMFNLGMNLRTALVSTVYEKSLIISNTSRNVFDTGEIVNLMSVDAQRLQDLIPFLHSFWSSPLQILIAIGFLWNILGPSALAGLAVMVLLIPVNSVVSNALKKIQTKLMEHKDNRTKKINEILNSIKVLKLNAWELFFQKDVHETRVKEVKFLNRGVYLNAFTWFLWNSTPFVVSLASFGCFTLVSDEPLTAERIFVSLALFNVLRIPLTMLPMLVSNWAQASVSLKRLNKFIASEDLKKEFRQSENETIAISMDSASFGWDRLNPSPTLESLNFEIKKGSLVGIVGSVGSGKSSLCSAFLGEMEKISGHVTIQKTVCYVAQEAWIQNLSLKDNILFGKNEDSKFYNEVIDACALRSDIDLLPGGDKTEIGEKGINLSGGQKQRVSLARAVYSDSEICILDDALSAVDTHVSKHIFERVIGPIGMLKNKTRVFVTHGLTYLSQMDHIIVMKDGKISEQGSYEELFNRHGDFKKFLDEYLNENKEHGSAEVLESKNQNETKKIIGSDIMQTNEKTPSKLIKEKTEVGRVSSRIYGYYIRSVGLTATSLTFLFYGISRVFDVTSKLWLARWSQDENSESYTNYYLGIYSSLGLAQGLSSVVGNLIGSIFMILAAAKIHELLLNRILVLPQNFFDITPVGRILSRFTKDINVLDLTLPPTIGECISIIMDVLATFVLISYTTPLYIIVIIPILIVFFLMQKIYIASSRQLKRLESVSRSPIYSHFSETLLGVSTIRAYGKCEEFKIKSQERVDLNQVNYFASMTANRWLAVRLEFLGNILTFSVAMFIVFSEGTISSGEAGLILTYSLKVATTLNWLVRLLSDVETNIVAVERIEEYAGIESEAPLIVSNNRPAKDWPHSGKIEFENYSTRYRPGLDLVLNKINLSIQPQEKVGVVGRTGAGKSSLTLGLFRIIEPTQGRIMIDGIDISRIGLHDLRQKLTVIPQDPVLFSGTLRKNLDPSSMYRDSEIWKSLDHSHLKSFITGMSSGLQYEITERGQNLSVGQRQLVCLARALLRKSKILILDEATAAVDMETDDLIQQTIRKEFSECTVITIAHRLNTIMDSNRVVVLDQGRICEFGTPEELLSDTDSIFYSMAKESKIV